MTLPRVPQRTTPGFAFSMVQRAINDCLSTRAFGQREVREVLAFLGTDPPECAFCGSKDVKRWDHLVPIKQGGETVLGNMVLSCARCDDSKQDTPFEKWMLTTVKEVFGVKDVDARLGKIREYVQKFGYKATSLEERLGQDEMKRLEDIRRVLAQVRENTDTLISDYRKGRK
jgi:hypothetical protein